MGGKKREVVVTGSGNVFRDLGFADSEDRKLRVQLAVRLNELIDEQRLSQAAVAKRFGVPQPHVSDLRNYKLSRFSSERLVPFLPLLSPGNPTPIPPPHFFPPNPPLS